MQNRIDIAVRQERQKLKKEFREEKEAMRNEHKKEIDVFEKRIERIKKMHKGTRDHLSRWLVELLEKDEKECAQDCKGLCNTIDEA